MKKFIGTLLINELVHAVRRRSDLPQENRHQFCIFIDEFQNFAYSEDFPILFMEARKLGIATTVAHQERYGQLLNNQKIQGATDAAANKIFFQLTANDASEQASEFAKEPTKEVKLEQPLVISQEPFSDLLKGHTNPVIQRFVRHYLRPINERQQNIKDEMEYARLSRLDYLDEAALHRIDEQMFERYLGAEKYFAMKEAQKSIARARNETKILETLWERSIVTRETIRFLNRTFVALMEGDLKPEPGEELFSMFFQECVRSYSRVPGQYVEALALYISLVYGNSMGIQKFRVPYQLILRSGMASFPTKPLYSLTRQRSKPGKQGVHIAATTWTLQRDRL
jgi:hypothetical protein